MTQKGDLLIHHLIDSVQQSIEIADQTSRKKYNFSLARMNIKMTLDFEIKSDESKSKSQASEPKHWFSLFSRKRNPQLSSTEGDAEDRHGSLTMEMLFKPGGKALLSTTPAISDMSDNADEDTDDDSSSSSSEDDLDF